jgi:hypothetical protein
MLTFEQLHSLFLYVWACERPCSAKHNLLTIGQFRRNAALVAREPHGFGLIVIRLGKAITTYCPKQRRAAANASRSAGDSRDPSPRPLAMLHPAPLHQVRGVAVHPIDLASAGSQSPP